VVSRHSGLERLGRCHRDIELLARDEFPLEERLEPGLLHLGVFELRLGPRELRLRLPIGRFEGSPIDLETELARLDGVAFLEGNGLEHSRHLGADLDAVLGLDGADCFDQHRHRFRHRLGGLDDGRSALASTFTLAASALGRAGASLLLPPPPAAVGADPDHQEQHQHHYTLHRFSSFPVIRSVCPIAYASRASAVYQSRYDCMRWTRALDSSCCAVMRSRMLPNPP